MSTGREAHDSELGGWQLPGNYTIAQQLHRAAGVFQRNLFVTIRQTILEHGYVVATREEELRHVQSFVAGGGEAIASARTDEDGGLGSFRAVEVNAWDGGLIDLVVLLDIFILRSVAVGVRSSVRIEGDGTGRLQCPYG